MDDSQDKQGAVTANILVWGLTALGFLLPLYIWGDLIDWDLEDNFTALRIFPLLGLWAYFQMWVHYIVGPVRRKWPEALNYSRYYRLTSHFVLISFLLHPALLLYAGTQNDFTTVEYVGNNLAFYIYLAYFGIATFLAYEVVERIRDKQIIKDNWETVKVFNIAAMTAIFFHSINLGQHLQSGWFRTLWIVMYVVFVLVVVEGYLHRYWSQKHNPTD